MNLPGNSFSSQRIIGYGFDEAEDEPVAPPLRKWFSDLVEAIERQPAWLQWLEAIALVLLTGFTDYVTGYEVSVVLFYSVPILAMVRFADQKSATFIALLCSLAWWWADEASGHHYTSILHQAWETGVRLSYFLLFVAGGGAVRSRVGLLARARRLEQEIIRTSEREQHRIGQDLHDSLCQYFAAIGFTAGSLKARLERSGSAEASAAQEIQELILDGVQQTRSLARGLFPVQNDEWGLPSALSELAASTSRLLNLRCSFTSELTVVPVSNTCSTHFFRIAQEAVSNGARHSGATAISIQLRTVGTSLVLSVEDDGTGFLEIPCAEPGMGRSIMHHRARQIGAKLTLKNNAVRGASVVCELALPSQNI